MAAAHDHEVRMEQGEESPDGVSAVVMILEPGCPRCAEIRALLGQAMS